MAQQISPDNVMLMQDEIREAMETIVRKHVGWKSFRFDHYPQIMFNETGKELTINFSLKTWDTGNDVIEIDHRRKLLKMEFLTG